ncbi:hypothetical protein BLS_009933 [Venturia inaequalis]|uniref:AP-2 complex subunit alpha n=1 Tax=Venturia inaequalis TaxID=5025 RepID=A0A8H3UYX7_VENIN|nr:hypothetical protein BLS_009933 [Venturia inaequalis]
MPKDPVSMATGGSTGGLFSRSSPGNTAPMRGLVTFIADLRNARARELEEKRINKELANIRQKFRDGKLGGYDRKKYVCKLLYIYILGWNVDFGHLEAVNLVSGTKYSEKQIGYLAVTLFLHEEHELVHLVINSIRKDLENHNELNNCLALHAIANVGGKEMGEALSGDKAALTMLRLYRKFPGIVQVEWAERIISLMDDPDLGVALSVTSLVIALVQDNPDRYKASYVKAARRLKAIAVDGECSVDYLYYKVPCPWIQVKLLKLLQYYPPSEDSHIQNLIRESLQRILECAMEMPKNVQQNNAQNAVLFEAINLVIHLDTERELMVQISSRLGKFIQSRETNVRYLGLEAMTHLAARAETLDPIKKHQAIIIGSLRDRDISVRRQGLDLLYSMCDATNAQPIVSELLKYLQTADYAIREEMVLKIAILTEKYATDIQWYVDISLKLIAMAGDHVSDEVWQRVCQIVTNNEELQPYAAHTIFDYMKKDHCHETLVKIAAYILGECCYHITDNSGCSPIEQFMGLHAKMQTCSFSTQAMILSCFFKFVNLLPEIKPQLLQTFRAYSHSMDPELQQRACEYLNLATMTDQTLLQQICDEMPPFPERASPLLSRLHSKHATTSDRRTWAIGGKDANADQKEVSMMQSTGLKRSFTNASPVQNNKETPPPLPTGNNGSSNGNHDLLAGLDMTDGAATKSPNFASAEHLSADWERGYYALLTQDGGLLYEDAQIQVGLRSEYRGQVGYLKIYFKNKFSSPIGSFTTTLDNKSAEALKTDMKSLPDTVIHPEDQAQQTIGFEAKSVFTDPPTIRISYLAGALQALTLQLPVVLTKYMAPAELEAEDFFKRWKQIGGGTREAQSVFGMVNDSRTVNKSFTRKAIEGFNWSVLDGVDPNSRNICGASVLKTGEGGNFGCLLRLEPNYDTNMYRLTIRATDEVVPPILLKAMESKLAQGDLGD